MKTLRYSIQRALRSIWREKWINLLTILSVSIGLLIFCLFLIISKNLDTLLERWAKGYGIIVYLDREVTQEQINKLESTFRRDSEIENVIFVSVDEAYEEVRKILGNNEFILDVFQENPLPPSFELKLREDILTPDLVKKKAEEIIKMQGVNDVQYAEKWLSSLYSLSKALRIGSLAIGTAIFIAITFITYSTIKIFFYRRKEEIETLKLLGATRMFTRMPFLIEGIFIGTWAGILTTIFLYLIGLVMKSTSVNLPQILHLTSLSLPGYMFVLIPITGALLSLIGSFIAVGKIRY